MYIYIFVVSPLSALYFMIYFTLYPEMWKRGEILSVLRILWCKAKFIKYLAMCSLLFESTDFRKVTLLNSEKCSKKSQNGCPNKTTSYGKHESKELLYSIESRLGTSQMRKRGKDVFQQKQNREEKRDVKSYHGTQISGWQQ